MEKTKAAAAELIYKIKAASHSGVHGVYVSELKELGAKLEAAIAEEIPEEEGTETEETQA